MSDSSLASRQPVLCDCRGCVNVDLDLSAPCELGVAVSRQMRLALSGVGGRRRPEGSILSAVVGLERVSSLSFAGTCGCCCLVSSCRARAANSDQWQGRMAMFNQLAGRAAKLT